MTIMTEQQEYRMNGWVLTYITYMYIVNSFMGILFKYSLNAWRQSR